MKRVSLKVAVQQAMDSMGLETSDDMPTFLQWGADAEKRIGNRKGLKKYITVLTASDCHIELPCNVVSVECVVAGDHGCDCSGLFDTIRCSDSLYKISRDSGLLVIDAAPACSNGNSLDWEIVNNRIEFQSNVDGVKFTLLVYSLVLDKKGLPLVNDTHVNAIAEWIEYRALNRSRWKGKRIQLDTAEKETEYHRLVRDARANDDVKTSSTQQELADIYNDPISGYGYYNSNIWE